MHGDHSIGGMRAKRKLRIPPSRETSMQTKSVEVYLIQLREVGKLVGKARNSGEMTVFPLRFLSGYGRMGHAGTSSATVILLSKESAYNWSLLQLPFNHIDRERNTTKINK
jgi:hypothetical protein